jgi:hypothetical protein
MDKIKVAKELVKLAKELVAKPKIRPEIQQALEEANTEKLMDLMNHSDDFNTEERQAILKVLVQNGAISQTPVDIKTVKKGEYLTLKDYPEPKESQVYVMDGYDRSERKYLIEKYDGSGNGRWLKPGTKVYVDFTF